VHNATFQPRRALQFARDAVATGPEPDTFSTASHTLRSMIRRKIRAAHIFSWTF
jgi:hypothetical protein